MSSHAGQLLGPDDVAASEVSRPAAVGTGPALLPPRPSPHAPPASPHRRLDPATLDAAP
ncbi:MAG: hypothetical protein ABSB59_43620 [Streptosporangiaceae bacterium]